MHIRLRQMSFRTGTQELLAKYSGTQKLEFQHIKKTFQTFFKLPEEKSAVQERKRLQPKSLFPYPPEFVPYCFGCGKFVFSIPVPRKAFIR